MLCGYPICQCHRKISALFFHFRYGPSMHRTSPRNLQSRARQGMYAMLPLLPGIVPFGLIAGFTPVSFGYTWIDSIVGSLLMFAGASQLAAYQLMDEGASMWVILMTVAAINLRYVLYSASIAPYLTSRLKLLKV